jgi:hypothetical protein
MLAATFNKQQQIHTASHTRRKYEGADKSVAFLRNKLQDWKNVFTLYIPPWAPHTYDFVVLTSLTHPRSILLVELQTGKQVIGKAKDLSASLVYRLSWFSSFFKQSPDGSHSNELSIVNVLLELCSTLWTNKRSFFLIYRVYSVSIDKILAFTCGIFMLVFRGDSDKRRPRRIVR